MLELDYSVQQEILDEFMLSLDLPEDIDNILKDTFNKVCNLGSSEISIKDLSNRANSLLKINTFIKNIDNEKVGGKPLRKTQKQAVIGLQNWLIRNLDKKTLMGHVVQPPSLGKTNISVLFSEFFEGTKIYIANDNIGVEQARNSFNNHLLSTIGTEVDILNYGVVVLNFRKFEKYIKESKVDLRKVGAIFIDEADVNALSDKRSKSLMSIGEEFKFPIIGLTATEIQGTGKNINKVFPGNIMSLPLPESLPYCLENKLVPDMQFVDVYLDAELYVSKKEIDKDIEDSTVESFFYESKWIDQVLDFHLKNYPDKNFIIAFRNNKINEIFIEIAFNKGIEVVSLDGNLSTDEKNKAIERFKKGEISLVGSKLVGRGLDIPECDVFYNSLLTYSPQLFWQGLGRNMRLDENNSDKKSISITFLPTKIINNDNNEFFPKGLTPLCSASFFYNDYYTCIADDFPTRFDLSSIKPDEIKSIQSIMNTIKNARLHSRGIKGKLDLISEAASKSNIKGYMSAQRIVTSSNKFLLDIIEEGKGFEEYRKEDDKEYISEEDNYYIDYYSSICKKRGVLDIHKERKLINSYIETGNVEFKNQLLEYSLLSIIEIVKGLYINIKKKVPNTDLILSELINEGCISFLRGIDKFKDFNKGRPTKFALLTMISNITRYIYIKGFPILDIPSDKGNRILGFLNDDRKNSDFNNILTDSSKRKIENSSSEKAELLKQREQKEKELEGLINDYFFENHTSKLPKNKLGKLLKIDVIAFLDEIIKINGDVKRYITKEINFIKKGEFINKDSSGLKDKIKSLQKLLEKVKSYGLEFRSIKNDIEKIYKKIDNIGIDLVHIEEYKNLVNLLIDEESIDSSTLGDGELQSKDSGYNNYIIDERKKVIKMMLVTLTPREAKVLEMSLGINMNTEYSYKDIGIHFDVTSSRIKEIQAKGLRKLRHPSRAERLRSFF